MCVESFPFFGCTRFVQLDCAALVSLASKKFAHQIVQTVVQPRRGARNVFLFRLILPNVSLTLQLGVPISSSAVIYTHIHIIYKYIFILLPYLVLLVAHRSAPPWHGKIDFCQIFILFSCGAPTRAIKTLNEFTLFRELFSGKFEKISFGARNSRYRFCAFST